MDIFYASIKQLSKRSTTAVVPALPFLVVTGYLMKAGLMPRCRCVSKGQSAVVTNGFNAAKEGQGKPVPFPHQQDMGVSFVTWMSQPAPHLPLSPLPTSLHSWVTNGNFLALITSRFTVLPLTSKSDSRDTVMFNVDKWNFNPKCFTCRNVKIIFYPTYFE